MSNELLLARMRRRREQVVPLEDGLSVTIVRPPETEFGSMLKNVDIEKKTGTWEVGIDHVLKYTVGWAGFTEATLLGPEIGASDIQVPFAPDVWEAYVRDSIATQQKVADAILKTVVDFIGSKGEAEKNSAPG